VVLSVLDWTEGKEFHDESLPCDGKKSNRWRRNGKTRTLGGNPIVPVKHGLYTYGRITVDNQSGFHAATNCSTKSG
jgi:hypothetical protein